MEGNTPESGILRVPGMRKAALISAACALAIIFAIPDLVRAEELSSATKNLFAAIQRNDFGAVQLSVANGADPSARNNFGRLAVDLAVDKGHFEIAHYLLSLREMEAGGDAPVAEKPQASPPQAAAPQSTEMPDESKKPEALANLPPLPAPAPEWPIGEPNPFDPNTIPENARQPVISGGGVAGVPVMGEIIEPPAPQVAEGPETPAPEPTPDDQVATSSPEPAPTACAGRSNRGIRASGGSRAPRNAFARGFRHHPTESTAGTLGVTHEPLGQYAGNAGPSRQLDDAPPSGPTKCGNNGGNPAAAATRTTAA